MTNPLTVANAIQAVEDNQQARTGAATSAGGLTGQETIIISRGNGPLQTTTSAIAALGGGGGGGSTVAPIRQSVPVTSAGQTSYSTSGYTPPLVNVFVAGLRLNPSQYTATDGTNIVITDAKVIAILVPGMTVDVDALATVAVAGVATPASVAALLPANQPAVGTLTGAELVSVTQGAGLFQATLTKLSQWIRGTQGIATLVAGTVTIANPAITANTRIVYCVQTAGGTQGFLSTTRVVGTSFTIQSTSATETSTVVYQLFEPT